MAEAGWGFKVEEKIMAEAGRIVVFISPP